MNKSDANGAEHDVLSCARSLPGVACPAARAGSVARRLAVRPAPECAAGCMVARQLDVVLDRASPLVVW